MKILSPIAVSFAAILSALLAFGLQVLLSYNLTKSQFGIFIFLNAILNISITGGLFGVQHLWFSTISSSLESHINQIRSTFFILSIVSIFFYFFALVFGISTSQTSELMDGRLLFPLIFFLYIFGAVAWELIMLLLDIKQRFVISSFAKVMPHGLRFAIISLFIISIPDFKYIAIGNMIAGLMLIFLSYIFLKSLIKLNISFKISELFKDISQSYGIFKRSMPYFLHNILWIILMQLPILLSYIFLKDADSANTGIAFIILTGAMLLPSNLISRYLYPKLSQTDNMYLFYKRSIKWLSGISIFLGLTLIFISDFLILNLFPTIYIDSASILKIFGILIPFKIVANYISVFCILSKKIYEMNVIYASIILAQSLFFYLYSLFDQSFYIHFSFIVSEFILVAFLFYVSIYQLPQSKLN